VKNQIAADSFRRLGSNFFLLLQIGLYESTGDWRYINDGPKKLQAVTAEDIQRVASEYFAPENRAVAIYYRTEGTGGDVDPEWAAVEEALGPQMAQQFKTQVNFIKSMTDTVQLEQMLEQASSQMEMVSQAQPEMLPAIEYMLKVAKERLAELQSDEGGE